MDGKAIPKPEVVQKLFLYFDTGELKGFTRTDQVSFDFKFY